MAILAALSLLPAVGSGTVFAAHYRGAVSAQFLPSTQGCGHVRASGPGFSLALGTGSSGSGVTRGWACPIFAGVGGYSTASISTILEVALNLTLAPGARNVTVTVVHHVVMAGSIRVSGGCPTSPYHRNTSGSFNGGAYWRNMTGVYGSCSAAAQAGMRVYFTLIDETIGKAAYVAPTSAQGCSLSTGVDCEGGIQKVNFRAQLIDYGFERDTLYNATGWHYRNYTYSSNGTAFAGPSWNVSHLDRDVVTWHYSFVRGHVYALLAQFGGFAESSFEGYRSGYASVSLGGVAPDSEVSIPTITVT